MAATAHPAPTAHQAHHSAAYRRKKIGKEVVDKLANDTEWRETVMQTSASVAPVRARLDAIGARTLTIYGGLALLAIAVFAGRILRDRMTRVRVDYDQGLSAQGRRGLSILELSRMNEIPHADVCSGRGCCGTCRVHVDSGADHLSPLNEIEGPTLERVHAAQGDRLACQARVLVASVSVTRLLPAFADASAARRPDEWTSDGPAPAAEPVS